jgi:hypothetical protein
MGYGLWGLFGHLPPILTLPAPLRRALAAPLAGGRAQVASRAAWAARCMGQHSATPFPPTRNDVVSNPNPVSANAGLPDRHWSCTIKVGAPPYPPLQQQTEGGQCRISGLGRCPCY